MRELALPYLVVMAVFALRARRRQEFVGWLAAVAVFGCFYSWHMSHAGNLHRPGDLVSDGWLGLGGWNFAIATARWNTLLHPLPPPLIALAICLGVLGLAGASDERARRAALRCCGADLTAFLMVGRLDNYYWGILYTPLLPLGFHPGPAAVRVTSLRAARARANRRLPRNDCPRQNERPQHHVRPPGSRPDRIPITFIIASSPVRKIINRLPPRPGTRRRLVRPAHIAWSIIAKPAPPGIARTGYRQPAAEDHRRHTGDAHLAGNLVLALHQSAVGVAFQQFGHFQPVHAAKVGNVGQHPDVASAYPRHSRNEAMNSRSTTSSCTPGALPPSGSADGHRADVGPPPDGRRSRIRCLPSRLRRRSAGASRRSFIGSSPPICSRI